MLTTNRLTRRPAYRKANRTKKLKKLLIYLKDNQKATPLKRKLYPSYRERTQLSLNNTQRSAIYSIRTKSTKSIYLSQTACYDDNYKVYILEKKGAAQYPSELKRRVPTAIKIDYSNTCRYIGYVTYNRHEYQKKQNPRYGILYQILYPCGYGTQEENSGNDETSQ